MTGGRNLVGRARGWTVVVAVVVVAAVVLAGCGGGGGARSAAPGTTAAAPGGPATTAAAPATTAAAAGAAETTAAGPATTGAAASGPATTAAGGAGAGTQMRYVAPVDVNGKERGSFFLSSTAKGTCEPGSEVIGNVSLYRCFTGNAVYDPCWALDNTSSGSGGSGGATVLCLPAPWSKTVVGIVAPDVTAGISVSRAPLLPWGVELTTGAECLAVGGAHDQFRGSFVDYTCSAGAAGGTTLELLRGADTSGATWTYRSVERSGATLRPGPVVQVRTALFAGPSPDETPPGCQGSHVRVSAGASRSSGGHSGVTLLFANTGSATCSLLGYPGVALLDVHGHQVTQAGRAPSGDLGGLPPGTDTPPTVVLPPGQTASAVVEAAGTSSSTRAAGACADYPALLVTPPNTSTSVHVAKPLSSCGTITVHPVVIGTSGTAA